MPRAERRSAQPARSLARAESRAREARRRGLQAANAGRPAAGARYIRAGLRELGWAEDGTVTEEGHQWVRYRITRREWQTARP